MNHSVLSLRSVGSSTSTPQTSTYPSAYASEDEEAPIVKSKPFPFLELPSELRNKIYGLLFAQSSATLDLDPDNFRNVHRKTLIFFTSRQIYNEAWHHFYSTNTIRLFPCHGRFYKTKKPLLARLSPQYRSSVTSFELRLGPGFGAPPRAWVVNEALGLADCTNVWILKVMVEVDPSQAFLKGFCADGFYENFSKNLLDNVLDLTPSVIEVQFDAWSSVKQNGPMMKALLKIAKKHKKVISWGPERGWTDGAEDDDDDDVHEDWTAVSKPEEIPQAVLLASLSDVVVHA